MSRYSCAFVQLFLEEDVKGPVVTTDRDLYTMSSPILSGGRGRHVSSYPAVLEYVLAPMLSTTRAVVHTGALG